MQNTIELNGKRYDASTGRLITETQHISSQKHNHKNHATQNPIKQTIDGVRKPSRRSQATPVHASPPQHNKSHDAASSAHSIHKGKTKAERSKTLMRSAVKKPQLQTHELHMPNHTGGNGQKTAHEHVAYTSPVHTSIDLARAARAQHVSKSGHVSRFGANMSSISTHIKPLEVRPAPNIEHVSMPINETDRSPDNQNFESLKPVNRFDLAIEQSSAHLNPKHKRPSLRHRASHKLQVSPRTLNIATGVFVTLIIGGFLMYRNIPNIALKLASTRAGVNAKLPEYEPTGYNLAGPVQYTKGAVTLNYQSPESHGNYQITQKSSDWTSQSLLENFVASREPYQTFQDKGRTIYIYRGNNATWVSGGVWYHIEGDADLTADQLLRIVSGL